jgi:hypothetical protein
MTRETVAKDTPASFETSYIVAILPLISAIYFVKKYRYLTENSIIVIYKLASYGF